MSFSINFPLFLIVASLISAVICSVLNRKAARILCLTLMAVSVVLNSILFLYVYRTGQRFTYMMGHFPHPWGNELKISVLETVFSAVFSAVLFLSVLGGKKQLEEMMRPLKRHYFYTLCCLIQASLLALVYTNDLFTGYVFIEVCTIASIGILEIKNTGSSILAATRYLVFSLIGSALFLFGVIFLYQITGHLLMPNIKDSIEVLQKSGEYHLPLLAAISLITIGLAIKSGLWPFHLWMADTYGSAIPSASAILSGVISKGYIFLLIKIIYDVFGTGIFYSSGFHRVLLVLGAAGIVVGSFKALRENDIFRMTAFSSAAQYGYIFMGIGLSPVLGMQAALFHILVHAFTKPLLFISEGYLSDNMGQAKKFRNLQGAGLYNRMAGNAFLVGALSMIGIPLTMGFISKYLFGVAAFDLKAFGTFCVLTVLAVSTVLNTMYFARTILRIFRDNDEPERFKNVRIREQRSFVVAAVLFMAANIACGTLAKPLIDILARGMMTF